MVTQQLTIVNNSYKFTVPGTNQTISIPIEIKWDLIGRDESVDEYQDKVLTDVIGVPDDFEILRFEHKEYTTATINGHPTILSNKKSNLTYEFNFYSGNPSSVTSSTVNNWVNNYNPEGFSDIELYYKIQPFKKSFYKLDFYDSTDPKTQTISFSIILTTTNSETKNVTTVYTKILSVNIDV